MRSLKNFQRDLVKVTDPFWRKRMDVVRDQMIPYQWEALNDRISDAEPSHAIENFRIAAGESSGVFGGMVFQDSDVAKWLEAVAYSLATDPNPKLEETADDLIDLLARAQQEDGYLNTYYTLREPGKRWTNLRDHHELYCAGHFIEAAVAYYEATGKRKLLDIMCRYADYIDTVFGQEEGQIQGYPGHQEIELALVKLYQVTGNKKYLTLSQYFIDERGQSPHYFDVERKARGDTNEFWWDNNHGYSQAHLPVREQTKAVGHSVRAVYMYTAMADLAALTGDEALAESCKTLWKNVTEQQMYLTAGIGSMEYGEAFSFDYDLPNDLSYTETCASIGLVFWAKRMLNLEANAQYADVMERALYNGTISGMELDGQKFFYVNPLEVSPEACERKEKRHVKPVRQTWFGCACCPPNLARLIASIGQYIYSQKDDTIFVHLYMANENRIDINGHSVKVIQHTNYPWDGDVHLSLEPEEETTFTVALRIPGWCRNATLQVNGETINIAPLLNNGYVYLTKTWQKDDQINLVLPMPIEKIYANPKVRANAGKVALQRGPVVYCLEENDNGSHLHNLFLPRNTELTASFEPDLLDGVTVIRGHAERVKEDLGGQLYTTIEPPTKTTDITAVPYYAWCNREPGEMLVWINEKQS